MEKKIELLAPAKDYECGKSAIICGADAVYIGAENFGARFDANNSIKDIEQLINFAHKYWTKVYATVNTILDDDEILRAQKLIYDLYEIGIDAVIIQDMGLLELDLPAVPLFASTQTFNNNWQKVLFLEKVGFYRVILERSLAIAEIKEIRAKTEIELECFIHGSLCVSYSGQCYLSYANGGRSGNRGVCAQPCRKLYSLKDSSGNYIEKDQYLLCLKDLNLSAYLKALIDVGITSFKIEGRLKDVSYVKNIVSFYRNLLDDILSDKHYEKSSSGKTITSFSPDPYKTFNRQYTDFFINGRKKGITSFNTPKSTGKPIGKIESFDGLSFVLNCEAPELRAGDGICFFDKNKTLHGTNINKVIQGRIFAENTNHIKNGMVIFRNLDIGFNQKLKTAKIQRKIPVQISLIESGKELFLDIIDEDAVTARLKVDANENIAENKELAIKNIENQLFKLGDTEFFAEKIIIDTNNIYFIPTKDINEYRRNLIEKLQFERKKALKRNCFKHSKNNYPYPSKLLDFTGNVLNTYAVAFYKRHGVEKIEFALEKGLKMNGKKVLTTKLCLKYEFNLCPKLGFPASEEPIYLVDEKGKRYSLKFNCNLCEMEVWA